MHFSKASLTNVPFMGWKEFRSNIRSLWPTLLSSSENFKRDETITTIIIEDLSKSVYTNPRVVISAPETGLIQSSEIEIMTVCKATTQAAHIDFRGDPGHEYSLTIELTSLPRIRGEVSKGGERGDLLIKIL